MKTVEDFINGARILLQDTSAAPRYSDAEFQLALDLAFDEAYRIRPDIFIRNDIPASFITVPTSTDVPAPRGYQSAFLYYICGHVQLRDDEDNTDGRATVFLNKFIAQLVTPAA